MHNPNIFITFVIEKETTKTITTMIKATTKNGVVLFITLCDDVEPNKGGYYCEVYLDEDNYIDVDDFVIHKEDLDCYDDRRAGINAICEAYAKGLDDMPYLNREFNEIYKKVSDAFDSINEFYLKHITFNERCNPAHREEMDKLFDKMSKVKELAHDISVGYVIAEHYTCNKK